MRSSSVCKPRDQTHCIIATVDQAEAFVLPFPENFAGSCGSHRLPGGLHAACVQLVPGRRRRSSRPAEATIVVKPRLGQMRRIQITVLPPKHSKERMEQCKQTWRAVRVLPFAGIALAFG